MKRRLLWLIIPGALILAIVLVLFLQNHTAASIDRSLTKAGATVKHVTITDRLPFRLEIALQSASDDNSLDPDDRWFLLLAQHEAAFAYRWGPRLNSFLLVVENIHEEVLYSAETFHSPEDLNQTSLTSATSSVDDATTAEIVRSSLNLAGLSLSSLKVGRENTAEGSRRILQMTLTATSLQDANKSLTAFLGSFFKMLNTINMENDTALVLCRLQILDGQQTVLMDYVKDLESGYTLWSWDPGLSSDWLPQPPFDAQATPSLTLPVAYPADLLEPLEGTPVEGSYP
jgi:hypothetical protein